MSHIINDYLKLVSNNKRNLIYGEVMGIHISTSSTSLPSSKLENDLRTEIGSMLRPVDEISSPSVPKT
jgi:hypothetical protein